MFQTSSKFDAFKAEENLAKVEGQINQVKENLANLVQFAVDYFKLISTHNMQLIGRPPASNGPGGRRKKSSFVF